MKKLAPLVLASVLAALPGAAQAQSARAFERSYEKRDWAAAVEAGEAWAAREPENPTAAYNVACAHALAGQAETALLWLERAGRAGFAGTRSLDEDPDLASARALEGFEAAVAGIRANRARMLRDFQAEAERSEILVILPGGNSEGPRPLLVVLHGFGGAPAHAERYRQVAREFGAIIAAPGAIRPGPRGKGFSWTFRDEAEWWVPRAIARVAAEHPIDRDRVVLAGYSQGANVALSVALQAPESFAGVLAVAGHYEAHWMRPPQATKLGVYLLTGQKDPAINTFRQAERVLRADGLDVRLRVVPGLGHAFPPRATYELRKAFDFLLPDIARR